MNRVMGQLTHFVNGEQKAGKSDRYGNVYNPSTGEVIFQCPYSSREEVNETVEIASIAFADGEGPLSGIGLKSSAVFGT